MRICLLVLMMVLLPLRAWAGDSMALSVLDSPAGVHCAEHTGPGVMPTEHGAGAVADPLHASAPDGGHLCCDICNGPVLTTPPCSTGAIALPALPSAEPRVAFASTVPRRDHKPPIDS
jgi:hypothetical protein